ncbi:GntR family transcriptional regulator [Humibacter ginsengisoli]
MSIDLTGAAPPSDQIYQHLRGQILSGRLVPGERLATVRQLARDLGVAPGTVARAYKQLEVDQLIITKSAAGTRVSERATAIPADVLYAARALHERATQAGLTYDQTTAALRTLWNAPE